MFVPACWWPLDCRSSDGLVLGKECQKIGSGVIPLRGLADGHACDVQSSQGVIPSLRLLRLGSCVVVLVPVCLLICMRPKVVPSARVLDEGGEVSVYRTQAALL